MGWDTQSNPVSDAGSNARVTCVSARSVQRKSEIIFSGPRAVEGNFGEWFALAVNMCQWSPQCTGRKVRGAGGEGGFGRWDVRGG